MSWLLELFQVSTDQELIDRMTLVAVGWTVFVGLYTFFFPAPYGRYTTSWVGPCLPAKLAWLVQEIPVCIAIALLRFVTPSKLISNPGNFIPVTLVVAHYVNRAIIYPLKLNSNAKPVPLLTILSAFLFCSYNGIFQGHHLLNVGMVEGLPFVVAGSLIFVLGMAVNIHHDDLLRDLRKSSEKGSKQEYKIPHGGLFDYISGANYFGEILEWWGLALVTRQNPQIIFAVFTSIFLGLRAIRHHAWYKEKFGEKYPSSRTAVIPFLL
ncbi:unnamed protein product [Allacma fusca]|uniref:3-oxo-5alpha-steroid 4-dehydrogenase (NADP(+)) n=1 Tax=Allacma fusca TaxID=39272 RepID=A0A8J2JGV2_9HEXA|nr:unnamed protein product [Allacma fusca]